MQRLYKRLHYLFLFLTTFALHAKKVPKEHTYCEGLGEGPGYIHRDLQLEGLAPGRINTCSDWTFAVSGSFIYWNAMQESMGIASLRNADTPPVAMTTYQHTQFRPGFKATLVSNVSEDSWIGKAEYTRLHGTTDTQTAPPPGGEMVVNPGFTSPSAVNQSAAFVTSSFKVSLDTIDLFLARPSYFAHMLILTPFAGPKFGFIDQRLQTRTRLVSSNTEEIPAQYDTDTWFVGPKFGIDIDWIFGYGFKSLSSFSCALLYQRQKVRADFYDTTNVNDNNLDLQRTYRFFRPNFQMSLGFSWGSYFGEKAVHVSIFSAYEIDYYLAQNAAKAAALENFYTNSQTSNYCAPLGDLVFHGLKTGLQFDF